MELENRGQQAAPSIFESNNITTIVLCLRNVGPLGNSAWKTYINTHVFTTCCMLGAESVLIHSVRGQSRSCCVLAAYMMKKCSLLRNSCCAELASTNSWDHKRQQDVIP
eukprot:4015189-Amphidinium_carterae.1